MADWGREYDRMGLLSSTGPHFPGVTPMPPLRISSLIQTLSCRLTRVGPTLVAVLASPLLALSAGSLPAQAQELPLSESFMPGGVSEYDGAIHVQTRCSGIASANGTRDRTR